MNNDPAELSARIGRVMGEVLVREPLGADEDFFKSGGDSLRAVEMLQRLARLDGWADRLGTPETQARLLEEVFEVATPRALAAAAYASAS
ncbi:MULTISPECIES: phosphopantetheine-binding protein [Micromonospora]|uniref:Carrier domain-containing protein n=3 Tax=Micromonospora TaxID=1873 RepID=A0A9X0I247_9ACTN|nr:MULTISPECIES: phosphopantetheine-binding protein [Micromonospora]AIS85452.1 hypothetical protein VASRM7_214 [Verrucosispora sp. MS100047]AEB46057.1 hypothetical protein VAB18032_24795 [Micromonospora maris AB-18-032]KUJ45349.1 hypothetical protein ADL17_19920 [Micromonospora maris]MBL6278352.1 hypothetical protein [Micromonospora fiedleri]RUL94595.1 hypothetical protein EG812_02605 [Verrucosispora sp. FIM060022]